MRNDLVLNYSTLNQTFTGDFGIVKPYVNLIKFGVEVGGVEVMWFSTCTRDVFT